MEINSKFLKSRLICPVLIKNKWDFVKEEKKTKLFKTFVYSAVNWLAKRGGHISWDALEFSAKKKMWQENPLVVAQVLVSLEDFYRLHYKRMTLPLSRQKIEIEFYTGTIFCEIPVINDGDPMEFYFFEDVIAKGIFTKTLDVRIVTLWSILASKDIVIRNINPNDPQKTIEFKPTGAYIENCKRVIESIIGPGLNREIYPPEEICKICQNREHCPV